MTTYRYTVWLAKGVREFCKSGFESASKSFESLDHVDLNGRSFLITGANSGIGLKFIIKDNFCIQKERLIKQLTSAIIISYNYRIAFPFLFFFPMIPSLKYHKKDLMKFEL